MNLRGLSAALFIVPVLLAVLVLAGCGGGEQSGNGSQDGGAPGKEKKEEKKERKAGVGAANKGGPQPKIAVGTIVRTDPESEPNGKVVLRPTAQVQGGERMIFKLAENAEISLDDKKAELAEIKKGQDAQIQYTQVKVATKDSNKTRVVNRASVVHALSKGGGNGGG